MLKQRGNIVDTKRNIIKTDEILFRQSGNIVETKEKIVYIIVKYCENKGKILLTYCAILLRQGGNIVYIIVKYC